MNEAEFSSAKLPLTEVTNRVIILNTTGKRQDIKVNLRYFTAFVVHVTELYSAFCVDKDSRLRNDPSYTKYVTGQFCQEQSIQLFKPSNNVETTLTSVGGVGRNIFLIKESFSPPISLKNQAIVASIVKGNSSFLKGEVPQFVKTAFLCNWTICTSELLTKCIFNQYQTEFRRTTTCSEICIFYPPEKTISRFLPTQVVTKI